MLWANGIISATGRVSVAIPSLPMPDSLGEIWILCWTSADKCSTPAVANGLKWD